MESNVLNVVELFHKANRSTSMEVIDKDGKH